MTRLTGTLRGLSGQPVADAAVYFLEGPVPLPDVAQLTGDDGGFFLSAPEPGTYRLQVNAPVFAAVTVTVEVRNEPETICDISLK